MEPKLKNKPSPLVLIAVGILAVILISYLILMMFFPDLFQSLSVGELEPVVK